MQVFFAYKSISILVDHIESLFELLNLGLIEHGENIACRSLSPFLR